LHQQGRGKRFSKTKDKDERDRADEEDGLHQQCRGKRFSKTKDKDKRDMNTKFFHKTINQSREE